MENKLVFEEVYKTYYNEVFNRINFFKVNYDSQLAEELTNDTFMKVYRHLDSYDESRASLKTWLFFICDNIVTDYYRSKQRMLKKISKPIIDENDGDTDKPIFQIADNASYADDLVNNNEKQEYLAKQINKLTEVQKNIFLLKFEGFKLREIAEMLNISLNNVKVNMFRGREVLGIEI